MAKYRKKPVIIEAIQFIDRPEKMYELAEFLPDGIAPETIEAVGNEKFDKVIIRIPTLEGEMIANEGDWIIKGINGEFYPCKPDIFEQTYERV